MSTHFKDPFVWIRGLLAAIIGGSASAGASWMGMAAAKMAGIDVPTLNLKALGIILMSAGLASMFAYLMKSPLPELVTVEDTSTIKTVTTPGQAPTVTAT